MTVQLYFNRTKDQADLCIKSATVKNKNLPPIYLFVTTKEITQVSSFSSSISQKFFITLILAKRLSFASTNTHGAV